MGDCMTALSALSRASQQMKIVVKTKKLNIIYRYKLFLYRFSTRKKPCSPHHCVHKTESFYIKLNNKKSFTLQIYFISIFSFPKTYVYKIKNPAF